jgi:hypothetical protein
MFLGDSKCLIDSVAPRISENGTIEFKSIKVECAGLFHLHHDITDGIDTKILFTFAKQYYEAQLIANNLVSDSDDDDTKKASSSTTAATRTKTASSSSSSQTLQPTMSIADELLKELTPSEQARVNEKFEEAYNALDLCNGAGKSPLENTNLLTEYQFNAKFNVKGESVQREPIDPRDLARLRTREEKKVRSYPNLLDKYGQSHLHINMWLSDNVINFFMQVLNQQERLKGNKNFFFSSSFLAKLLEGDKGYNYENVKAWNNSTRRKESRIIFEMSQVFFPYNIDDVHWALVVANIEERTLTYYDSSYDSTCDISSTVSKAISNNVMNNLLRYLKDEDNTYYKGNNMKNQWTMQVTKGPQQANTYDCGVFLIANCVFLSEKRELLYSQVNMDNIRKRICYYIITPTAPSSQAKQVSKTPDSSSSDKQGTKRSPAEPISSSSPSAKKTILEATNPKKKRNVESAVAIPSDAYTDADIYTHIKIEHVQPKSKGESSFQFTWNRQRYYICDCKGIPINTSIWKGVMDTFYLTLDAIVAIRQTDNVKGTILSFVEGRDWSYTNKFKESTSTRTRKRRSLSAKDFKDFKDATNAKDADADAKDADADAKKTKKKKYYNTCR